MTAKNKILVVDDDPNTLSATVGLLKKADYEVFEANTGQECMAAAQANHPDLVLLDIMLPDTNGLEVCRQIKTMPSLAHLFVVLISASQTSSDQPSIWLESGADGYIALPISNRELLARVQALLRIKRAEDALRESEARYTRTLQAVNDGIWDWHIPSGQAFFSALYYTLLGYEDGEFPATYDAWRLLVHPEDIDRVERELQKSIETGSGFNIELRMRKKTGQWLWVCTRGRMSEVDSQGKALRMVGVLSDITQHKQAEETLQKFVMLAESSSEFIGMCDLNLKPLYVNAAGVRMVGLPDMAAACQVQVQDYFFPEDQRFMMEEFFPRVLRESHGEVEIRLRHFQTGEAIWMNYYLFSVRDTSGGIVGWATVSRDITERKRVEDKFREITKRLHHATTSTKAGVWDWNLQTNEMIWDDRMLELYGRTREDFPGGIEAWEQGLHPDDAAKAKGECEAALRGERDFDTEFRVRHPDGTVIHIKANGLVLRDDQGKPLRMIGLNTNITEHKKLEAQLRQSQKQEAIGQLAGGVAHDFNNILAAMMMNIGSMEQNPNLDAETQESLKELLAEAERAASLIRQLLLFSRKSVMEKKVLDLNEVVANLLKMLGRLIGEHVSLRFERANGLPWVEADQGMIEQVLMNLAVNARDAMPNGGRLAISLKIVPIGAEGIKGQADVLPGTFICLAVQDTGCGMDQATQNQIFEPFFTTKEVGKGTGLGLATVYGIAALHKGWVEVESEVGQGTTFRVYLPQRMQGIAEPDQTVKRELFRGQETILLVEDNDAVRRMSVRGLKGLGYQVLEAHNGLAGLKLWQEHPGQINLLLTDMVMPEGLTGLALAEQLKAEKPNLKVIICSGYNEDMSGQTTAELKGIQYLQKPYSVALLSKKVRECLDGA